MLALDIMPKLLEGVVVTIELTIIAIMIGIFIGIPVAMGRVYGNKPLYAICTFFVEIIRGTPLLTQLFILYFGLPSIGIMLSPFTAAMIYRREDERGRLRRIAVHRLHPRLHPLLHHGGQGPLAEGV
ncbi:MAG: ABC transporter permease subunit [Planctomycetota bacterium]